MQAVDDEYYYYKRPLSAQTVVSPHLLKVVQVEKDKREKEATLMKTKQEPEVVCERLNHDYEFPIFYWPHDCEELGFLIQLFQANLKQINF